VVSLMLQEIGEAPEALVRLISANEPTCRELAERLRRSPPSFAVTCARGSSDSAAMYVKYLLEIRLGLVVASVGPSVSSIYRVRPHMANAVFVAISQSGRSPDLVTLAEAARQEGALTVALVNDVTSPLAASCEVVLPLHAGPELSVAATKSYIASLAAFLQLLAYWSADPAIERAVQQLPDDVDDARRGDWEAALPVLTDKSSLYVTGRGPGYAVALEAALKLKETCGLHAEAISAAELIHGPLALVGADFPVIVLSQDDAALGSLSELAARLTRQGVPVIACGPGAWGAALTLPSATGLHPFAQPICQAESFYGFAEGLARARGFDPDRPPHLHKVTETR
jgi:glucosamine--fructose-6-phosphate aminotransferase (isomerizing)